MAQQTILNISNLLHTATPAGLCPVPAWKSYVPVREQLIDNVTALLRRDVIRSQRMDQQIEFIQRPDLVPIQA